MCGEKLVDCRQQVEISGSPPRVRGKAPAVAAHFSKDRITPACAGKSRRQTKGVKQWRDHPRVCGEKALPFPLSPISWGSPPRVRGKELRLVLYCQRSGITPACAGKRSLHANSFTLKWDHPRVCGEKNISPLRLLRPWGSPPRVRGKAYSKVKPDEYMGITPACAGKRPC